MKVFHYCDATVIAAKEPFQVELVEGKKYSWCKCGLSKKQVTSYAYKLASVKSFKADAQNCTFKTIYGGQFTLSTQLIILNNPFLLSH